MQAGTIKCFILYSNSYRTHAWDQEKNKYTSGLKKFSSFTLLRLKISFFYFMATLYGFYTSPTAAVAQRHYKIEARYLTLRLRGLRQVLCGLKLATFR